MREFLATGWTPRPASEGLLSLTCRISLPSGDLLPPQRLPEFDGEMTRLQEEAARAGEVLRYVGSVDVAAGKGSVELRNFPASHPFAQLGGTDNIVLIRTKRYDPQPLVVTGPGAGADVTAGGVFADLVKLCAHFGAPS